jgi:hypothetical protein
LRDFSITLFKCIQYFGGELLENPEGNWRMIRRKTKEDSGSGTITAQVIGTPSNAVYFL